MGLYNHLFFVKIYRRGLAKQKLSIQGTKPYWIKQNFYPLFLTAKSDISAPKCKKDLPSLVVLKLGPT